MGKWETQLSGSQLAGLLVYATAENSEAIQRQLEIARNERQCKIILANEVAEVTCAIAIG